MEPGSIISWHTRRIPFWMVRKYLDHGWTINTEVVTRWWSPFHLMDVAFQAAFPLAVKTSRAK